LDETDRKILDLLKQEGPLSTKFIAQHIGLTERSIRPRLTKLIEKGKVNAIGRSHKDPHKKYGIVEGST
jgi:DNA-binding Lrp family transcriptional regulator